METSNETSLVRPSATRVQMIKRKKATEAVARSSIQLADEKIMSLEVDFVQELYCPSTDSKLGNYPQPLPLLARRVAFVKPPRIRFEYSHDLMIKQLADSILGASSWVNVEHGKKEDQAQITLASTRAVEVTPPATRRHIAPELEKEELRATLMFRETAQVCVDGDREAQDFDAKPLTLAMRSAVEVKRSPLPRERSADRQKQEQRSLACIVDSSSKANDPRGKEEDADHQLILHEATSAIIEVTSNTLLRDGTNLALTTSDSTEETPHDTDNSTMYTTGSSEGLNETELVARGSTQVADEKMSVHEKYDIVQEVMGKAKPDLFPNQAIDGAQYAKNRFNESNTALLAVVTLAMIACCIKAAACWRTYMASFSIGKQDIKESIKTPDDTNGGSAKSKKSKRSQKQSLKTSKHSYLSSDRELQAFVAVCELERQEEDASTPERLRSSTWFSMREKEKDNGQQTAWLRTASACDKLGALALVTDDAKVIVYIDQQAASTVAKHAVKVTPPPPPSSPDTKNKEDRVYPLRCTSTQVIAREEGTGDEVKKSAAVVTPPRLREESTGEELAPDGIPVASSKVDVQHAKKEDQTQISSPPATWRQISPEQEEEELRATLLFREPVQVCVDGDGETTAQICFDGDGEARDFDRKPLTLAMRSADKEIACAPLPKEGSTDRQKQEQRSLACIVDSSSKANDQRGKEEDLDHQLILHEATSAIDVTSNTLLRDGTNLTLTTSGSPGETSLGGSTVSTDESTHDEDGTSMSTESLEGQLKRVLFCTSPPQAQVYEPIDHELILAVARSAIEATKNALLGDCPSLASTTPGSPVSTDEATHDEDASNMSTGSLEGSVKKVSFCSSPPRVREYERYMRRNKASSTNEFAPVPFNKKLRMLKKKLDQLSGDEASALPGRGSQAATRIVKKLGQAVLAMNASVLSQRR
jgi:hypothetical protein